MTHGNIMTNNSDNLKTDNSFDYISNLQINHKYNEYFTTVSLIAK